MPQMHLYVPEALAKTVRRRAEEKGLSVSKYLAELVRNEVSEDWDATFFDEVVGGWIGELTRPEQLPFESRDQLS